VEDPKKVDNI